MKFIALIEGKDVSVIRWCASHADADAWLAEWLRDNKATRPYVRLTVASCIHTIEG